MEKFYFAFCTLSATSGLLRTAAGDQTFHAGLYLRVVMLVSAVLVGIAIVRTHTQLQLSGSNVQDEGFFPRRQRKNFVP